jgi:hypothetical protein
MAAPPEAPPSGFWEDSKDGVEVSLFDESADGFSRTVRAIAELIAGEPELEFPEAEVERIASSVTFLRWKPNSRLPQLRFPISELRTSSYWCSGSRIARGKSSGRSVVVVEHISFSFEIYADMHICPL